VSAGGRERTLTSAGWGATPAPLKLLGLAALLLIGGNLAAQQIAVFGERDFYPLGAVHSARPNDPDRRAFLEAYRADRTRQAPYEESADLVSPPAWGKTIGPGTHGRLLYHPSFPRGFVCRLSLEGLAPGHDYILTLNGNPTRAGNKLLPTPVPRNEQERYYDFLIATTDARGRYAADLGIYLKPGAYDVRCYVKDTSDFKIVLYRDFFTFAVE
jgi:hypothetical protein